jgi:hypothetical protein
MRILTVCYVAAAVFVASCRESTEPAASSAPKVKTTATSSPPDLPHDINVVLPVSKGAVERCRLGSELGQDGTVSTVTDRFGAEDRVTLTMTLRQAPEPLQVALRVLNAKGKQVAIVEKAATGLREVTLTLPEPLEPGRYKTEGYWGGNVACEQKIRVD